MIIASNSLVAVLIVEADPQKAYKLDRFLLRFFCHAGDSRSIFLEDALITYIPAGYAGSTAMADAAQANPQIPRMPDRPKTLRETLARLPMLGVELGSLILLAHYSYNGLFPLTRTP
jgi:hypothetical protein